MRDLSYILNILGEERARYFDAVAPPVILSSNFAFADFASFRKAVSDELGHTVYTRGNNPTVAILRQKLAALEGCEDALVFSSGIAAIAAAVMGLVRSGDHVVCVQRAYSWTHKLLRDYLPRFGVTSTFVDGSDQVAIEAAIQDNTRIIYLESPTSLTFELQDLAAVAILAKSRGIYTICDNSYASPLFQQPASLGIDLVVHSATKYLNGHSDVVAGALCGSAALISQIFAGEYMNIGAILGPQEAAMILRGLRTLELRLQRSHASALEILTFLKSHRQVRKVHYPWDPEHPQYELARRQMQGCGGLISFELDTDDPLQAERFFLALRCFLLAVSWGGHESLIFPIAALYNMPGHDNPSLPAGFIRLYIGLEDPKILIEDLRRGFAAIA